MEKVMKPGDLLPGSDSHPLIDDRPEGDFANGNIWPGAPIPKALGCVAGREADFPLDALGEEGSKVAGAFCEQFQAPAGLCGQAVISAMSATVSGWGNVQTIHGADMPMAVYLATVAQSGERKSTVDGAAQKGIKVFEGQLRASLAEQRAGMDEAEAAQDKTSADIIVNDPTWEGLLRTMSNGPGFCSLNNDDAAGFFGGHAMSRDQRQKTIAGLSQIWSGSDVRRARVHGQDQFISGVPLTMSLMFQPYLIPAVYGDRELVEQGLLPRVLPCFPPSTMGTRFFREPSANASQIIEGFSRGVFERLEHVMLIREARVEPKDIFAARIPSLKLSNKARKALIDFFNEVEAELQANGRYAPITGFANRAAENATRLAAIISLFDDIEASEVSEQAALSGRKLMTFYLEEFRHVLALGRSQKDLSKTGALGAWMAREYGAGGIGHDQHVSQHAPSDFRKKGDRQQAMRTLVDHGWIKMLPKGTVVGGSKRAEAFIVNPNIVDVV